MLLSAVLGLVSQPVQRSQVRSAGFGKGLVSVVRNTKFTRRIFYDFRQFRIVEVTNIRKQMVFDLEIQSTRIPTQEQILACKV